MKVRKFIFKFINHDSSPNPFIQEIEVDVYSNFMAQWEHKHKEIQDHARWMAAHSIWEHLLKKEITMFVKKTVMGQQSKQTMQNQSEKQEGGHFEGYRLVKEKIKKEMVKVNLNKSNNNQVIFKEAMLHEVYVCKYESGNAKGDWMDMFNYSKIHQYFFFTLMNEDKTMPQIMSKWQDIKDTHDFLNQNPNFFVLSQECKGGFKMQSAAPPMMTSAKNMGSMTNMENKTMSASNLLVSNPSASNLSASNLSAYNPSASKRMVENMLASNQGPASATKTIMLQDPASATKTIMPQGQTSTTRTIMQQGPPTTTKIELQLGAKMPENNTPNRASANNNSATRTDNDRNMQYSNTRTMTNRNDLSANDDTMQIPGSTNRLPSISGATQGKQQQTGGEFGKHMKYKKKYIDLKNKKSMY